jgi:hypothetical protein
MESDSIPPSVEEGSALPEESGRSCGASAKEDGFQEGRGTLRNLLQNLTSSGIRVCFLFSDDIMLYEATAV